MSESTLAELAKRFERRVAEVDELVSALVAAGINDRVAVRRYGLPTVFALGEAVLAQLDRPPVRALPPKPYLRAALRRSALMPLCPGTGGRRPGAYRPL